MGFTAFNCVHHVPDVFFLNMWCNPPFAHRQLERQESSNKSETEKLLLRLSSLQEENRSLAVDRANLSADVKQLESELELRKQANRYYASCFGEERKLRLTVDGFVAPAGQIKSGCC